MAIGLVIRRNVVRTVLRTDKNDGHNQKTRKLYIRQPLSRKITVNPNPHGGGADSARATTYLLTATKVKELGT